MSLAPYNAHSETLFKSFNILNSPAAKWHILTERGIEGYTMFYWFFGIS